MNATPDQQPDEPRFTGRQIVAALAHLRTLTIDDLISRDMIDYAAVVKDMKQWTVTLHAVGDRRITAIKLVRARSPRDHLGFSILGLAGARDLVDSVREGGPVVVLTTDDYPSANALTRELIEQGHTASLDQQ